MMVLKATQEQFEGLNILEDENFAEIKDKLNELERIQHISHE